MTLFSLLLLLAPPLQASSCSLGSVSTLVHDISSAAQTEWSCAVDNAMAFLEANNASSAKAEAHAVAEQARAGAAAGTVSTDDAAALQDAMGYVWHRAEDLEQAWRALVEGDFDGAKDRAHEFADRIRVAQDQGFLSAEQAQRMLALASNLWNLADGLDKTAALIARGKQSDAKDKAHQVAEQARAMGSDGRLTSTQRDAVVGQAGALYGRAQSGTVPPSPTGVPYFSQYANKINPGGSCQNTSVAMLLSHYGVKVTPDQISGRFGTSYAQDPAGLAKVFNTYASETGISQRLKAHTTGSLDGFNALLDTGTPVIVHGYFTGYGHVVLATGHDSSGYTVSDPAGVWSQRFKGGYSGSYNGDGVHYGTDAFVGAVATYDGRTVTTMWYHEVVETGG